MRITVYDVLGREVLRLRDGDAAAGSHEAVLAGSVLAPGVYIVQVEAGGERQALSIVKTR